MENFDDLVKSALETVAGGFRTALTDITEIIEALNKSLKSQVGKNFEIGLDEVQQNLKGAVYRITLDPDVEDFDSTLATIVFLRLSSKGYPVGAGHFNRTEESFSTRDILEDRAQLEDLFKAMLRDPNSSLIQALGFALRKTHKPK